MMEQIKKEQELGTVMFTNADAEQLAVKQEKMPPKIVERITEVYTEVQNNRQWMVCKQQFNEYYHLRDFECSVCRNRFSRKDNMRKHIKTHRKEYPYSCSNCISLFKTQSDFDQHTREAHPYNCHICKLFLPEKELLDIHVTTHCKGQVACSVCKNIFSSKEALVDHLTVHNVYSCSACNKYLTRKRKQFIIHMSSHTSERQFSCDLCKKSFKKKEHLAAHTTVHSQMRKFPCDVCGNSYKRKEHLLRHYLVHKQDTEPALPFSDVSDSTAPIQSIFSEGDVAVVQPEMFDSLIKNCVIIKEEEKELSFSACEKTESEVPVINTSEMKYQASSGSIKKKERIYKCDMCEKSYSRKNILHTHKMSHTGKYPFTCDICNKHFKDKCRLRNHMNSHTGEKPNPCEVCGRSFSQKANLKRHKQLHDDSRYVSCDICHKIFSQERCLKRHMNIHKGNLKLHCDICNQTFSTRTSLMFHMDIHMENRPYSCDICGKSFFLQMILNSHMRKHGVE